ncbi:hypothetical protein SAY86_018349 [Trapa natans]|uniref:Subtilisin-like protease fibronectin type-III domain-containing protein n=1 Tax=Trapa natans TaxID=22666 RepID=A0AAN7LN64_TRANT|nr:hypothetical protein SAY86_018349 [Trapa natans]
MVPQFNPDLKLRISVFPNVLHFKSRDQKQTFRVVVSGKERVDGDVFYSSMAWLSGKHTITVPITIYSMAQPDLMCCPVPIMDSNEPGQVRVRAPRLSWINGGSGERVRNRPERSCASPENGSDPGLNVGT